MRTTEELAPCIAGVNKGELCLTILYNDCLLGSSMGNCHIVGISYCLVVHVWEVNKGPKS